MPRQPRKLTNKEKIQAWTQNYVNNAVKFTACKFLGHGKYDVREAATLDEARLTKQTMIAEESDSRVLIYAITPDRLSIFVE